MASEFWSMGGYAVFVWGSFATAAAVYLWNIVSPRMRRNEILKQLSEGE